MPLIPPSTAHAFANSWIDAWNAHDLERVLDHFTDAIEFLSPVIVQLTDATSGRLVGKAALRSYWQKALARFPELHFELAAVLAGIDCLTVVYRGHRGVAAEVFHLDDSGRAHCSYALYGEFVGNPAAMTSAG